MRTFQPHDMIICSCFLNQTASNTPTKSQRCCKHTQNILPHHVSNPHWLIHLSSSGPPRKAASQPLSTTGYAIPPQEQITGPWLPPLSCPAILLQPLHCHRGSSYKRLHTPGLKSAKVQWAGVKVLNNFKPTGQPDPPETSSHASDACSVATRALKPATLQ